MGEKTNSWKATPEELENFRSRAERTREKQKEHRAPAKKDLEATILQIEEWLKDQEQKRNSGEEIDKTQIEREKERLAQLRQELESL
ncbi:MAG: hypothetical protein AAB786_00430 [Patescibacteria group bacterium]